MPIFLFSGIQNLNYLNFKYKLHERRIHYFYFLWILPFFFYFELSNVHVDLIYEASALQCWSCNSATTFCGSKFDEKKLPKSFLIECPRGPRGGDPVCLKVIRKWFNVKLIQKMLRFNKYILAANFRKKKNVWIVKQRPSSKLFPICCFFLTYFPDFNFISRYCVNNEASVEKYCYEGGNRASVCEECSSDGCNGAAKYGPAAAIVAIPIVILKTFLLF